MLSVSGSSNTQRAARPRSTAVCSLDKLPLNESLANSSFILFASERSPLLLTSSLSYISAHAPFKRQAVAACTRFHAPACVHLPAYIYLLTTLTGEPKIHDWIFSAVISMMRWRASFAAHEMCGVIMQFLAPSSGLSASIGSVLTTSTAAA